MTQKPQPAEAAQAGDLEAASNLLEGDDSVEFLAYRRLQTAIERMAAADAATPEREGASDAD